MLLGGLPQIIGTGFLDFRFQSDFHRGLAPRAIWNNLSTMNKSRRKTSQRPGASTWRLLKAYLLVAVPLLLLIGLRPEGFNFDWLDGIDLIGLTSWGIVILLALLVAWKVWAEYIRDKRR